MLSGGAHHRLESALQVFTRALVTWVLLATGTASARPLQPQTQHEVFDPSWSAVTDSGALVTSFYSRISVWNLPSLRLVTITPEGTSFGEFQLHPERQTVFALTTGGIVELSTPQLQEVRRLPYPGASELYLTDDGRWLVASDGLKSARAWDLHTDGPPVEARLQRDTPGHLHRVTSNAEGELVVVWTVEGAVRERATLFYWTPATRADPNRWSSTTVDGALQVALGDGLEEADSPLWLVNHDGAQRRCGAWVPSEGPPELEAGWICEQDLGLVVGRWATLTTSQAPPDMPIPGQPGPYVSVTELRDRALTWTWAGARGALRVEVRTGRAWWVNDRGDGCISTSLDDLDEETLLPGVLGLHDFEGGTLYFFKDHHLELSLEGSPRRVPLEGLRFNPTDAPRLSSRRVGPYLLLRGTLKSALVDLQTLRVLEAPPSSEYLDEPLWDDSLSFALPHSRSRERGADALDWPLEGAPGPTHRALTAPTDGPLGEHKPALYVAGELDLRVDERNGVLGREICYQRLTEPKPERRCVISPIPFQRVVRTSDGQRALLYSQSHPPMALALRAGTFQDLALPPGSMPSPDGQTFVYLGRLYRTHAPDDPIVDLFNFTTNPWLHAAFSPGGEHLLTTSEGLAHVWDTRSGERLATLAYFSSGDWVVYDAAGRFDIGDLDFDGLYYVVDHGDSLETIGLEQLAHHYYEPRLLRKLLDPALRLREVVPFDLDQLPPSVEQQQQGDTLHVSLTDRGGGVGRVSLFVDGREVEDDLRPSGVTSGAGLTDFTVDLSQYRTFLQEGGLSSVYLRAWNEGDTAYHPSRGVGAIVPPEAEEEELSLDGLDIFAIVVGSEAHEGYQGFPALEYAEDDAQAMARALQAGGEALLGELGGDVHVTLLSTAPEDEPPSLAALERAFTEVQELSGPEDILIVYFSGHGATHEGLWYYPWPDAAPSQLRTAAGRAAHFLSQEQLTAWLRETEANKRLLILDACYSGEVLYAKGAEDPADAQKIALAELEDLTGSTILAAAPGDRLAWEHPDLGHGLLTYALLEGMGDIDLLDDDLRWDVHVQVSNAAARVPEHARNLGLEVQRPEFRDPTASNAWHFGVRPPNYPEIVPLRETSLPVVMVTNFVEQGDFRDPLNLEGGVRATLGERQSAGARSLWVVDADEALPRTWTVGGIYARDEAHVTVNMFMVRTFDSGDAVNITQHLRAPTEAEAALTQCAATFIEYIASQPPPSSAVGPSPEELGCEAEIQVTGSSP